jgi:hypothetical protein
LPLRWTNSDFLTFAIVERWEADIDKNLIHFNSYFGDFLRLNLRKIWQIFIENSIKPYSIIKEFSALIILIRQDWNWKYLSRFLQIFFKISFIEVNKL